MHVSAVLLGSHLDLVQLQLESKQLCENSRERRQYHNLCDVIEQRVRRQTRHTKRTLQLLNTHKQSAPCPAAKFPQLFQDRLHLPKVYLWDLSTLCQIGTQLHGKGQSSPLPSFWPLSIVATWSPILATGELLFRLE